MGKSRMSTLVLFALLAGCASANTGKRPYNATPVNSNVITEKELDEFPSDDAYHIIERLHPEWLMNNARSSFGGTNPTNAIQVYMGGSDTWLGGVDVLYNYTATQLSMIYHIDAIHADNPNGAILLIKR